MLGKNRLWKNRFSYLGMIFTVICITLLVFLSSLYYSSGERDLQGNLRDSNIECFLEEDHLNRNFVFDNRTAELPLILSPLYSKINGSEALVNPVRANIYQLIVANPGISFGSITRELRISNGTGQYHLRVLERFNYVNSRRTGKHTRYYPMGTESTTLSETQERIVMVIKENPGISQSDVARELDTSRQLVNYHVKKLTDKQVIIVQKQVNSSFCFLIDERRK